MIPSRLSVLLLVSHFAANAIAADAPGPKSGTLSYMFDNDFFAGEDRHYTNGFGVVWIPDGGSDHPDWSRQLAESVPWFPTTGEFRHGYAFGQSMFMPLDTDRPYAGWLYAAFGVGRRTERRSDVVALIAGVVGPAAMARQVQDTVHRIVGSDRPRGWNSQLHNEPGLMATYQHSWLGIARSQVAGYDVDVTTYVGGAVGNVLTYGSVGTMVRFGAPSPESFGTPRVQPALLDPGRFTVAKGRGWYLFAGIEGRAVLHNIFLDGNTFRDSPSVDKKTWVSDLQLGEVGQFGRYKVEFTQVLRTKEFQSQRKADRFGAVSVSIAY
jgi:hypothetical protein